MGSFLSAVWKVFIFLNYSTQITGVSVETRLFFNAILNKMFSTQTLIWLMQSLKYIFVLMCQCLNRLQMFQDTKDIRLF